LQPTSLILDPITITNQITLSIYCARTNKKLEATTIQIAMLSLNALDLTQQQGSLSGLMLFGSSTILAALCILKRSVDEQSCSGQSSDSTQVANTASNSNNHRKQSPQYARIAVNYHITRQCNYNCGFCFHTAKTSHVENEENAKRIIKELRDAGFRKINFAGGEPFLQPKLLGKLVQYAKVDCGYESVSIISNGSKVQEQWFKEYGKYLDILGISCDSVDEEINVRIGRGKGNHLQFVRNAAKWCNQYEVKFKLNTVVNKFNCHTDMSALLNEIQPMRWKIFQVLPLEGENLGDNATKRDVTPFLIENHEFASFIKKNRLNLFDPSIMKIEGNNVMQSSYILVDEYGCFLDSSTGGKLPTKSILDVGVESAWQELISSEGGGYDAKSFFERDGDYRTQAWSKSNAGCGAGRNSHSDIEDMGK
jgi:radical S-adenosyl methionine domain-containing protein 2